MSEDDYLGTTWQRATFNPAGFADTVEDWLAAFAHATLGWYNYAGDQHEHRANVLEELSDWSVDGEEDDVEMYILFAVQTYTEGPGFTPCTGCSEC